VATPGAGIGAFRPVSYRFQAHELGSGQQVGVVAPGDVGWERRRLLKRLEPQNKNGKAHHPIIPVYLSQRLPESGNLISQTGRQGLYLTK
jgi:hypothetical protein